jgi:hypothetical protein
MLERADPIRLVAFGLPRSQCAATRSFRQALQLHLWCD